MKLSDLKASLQRRAAKRKVYACHGARAYRVAHLAGAWNPPDNDGARFVDNLDAAGPRLVDYADKRIRLSHKGWYCDTLQIDTCRGAILQLAGKNGRPRYLAAYQESANDGYRVDVRAGVFGEEREAAFAADAFARIAAEHARDYDAAWQAGARYSELGENIREDRRAALALIGEIRAAGRAFSPAICATLRMRLEQLRWRIARYREERGKLREAGPWFVREFGAAFNDGAGEAVYFA